MGVEFSQIGARIRERRRQIEKTQRYLANGLDVTIGYISQLERGIAKINLETLQKIAELLDCDVTYLISGYGSCGDDGLTETIYQQISLLDREQKQKVLEYLEKLTQK